MSVSEARRPFEAIEAEGAAAPVFCFDLGSPHCYLVAEQVLQRLGAEVEWLPVQASALQAAKTASGRCDEPAGENARRETARGEDLAQSERKQVELRAEQLGLQPLRWPDPFPFDSSLALLAATYAKSIGRGTAFALAAFRQAFAGGHALEREDFVLIAAAACEMHPRAVRTALGSGAVADQLRAANARAIVRGATALPALLIERGALQGEHVLREIEPR